MTSNQLIPPFTKHTYFDIMRFSFLFFVVLVGFVANSMVSGLDGFAHYESALVVNQTFSGFMGALPTTVNGPVFVTMTTAYSIEVCLQEFVVLQGDLQACNPGGYFLFNRNSTSQANFFSLDEDSITALFGGDYETNFVGDEYQTDTQNTSLRGGSPYYISARLADSTLSNDTAYFDLQVSWNPVPCPDGYVGLLTGCVASNPTVLTTTTQNTIDGGTSQYFSVMLGPQDNQFLQTTASPLSNASASSVGLDKPMLFTVAIRRQAAPIGELTDANSTFESGTGDYVANLESPIPGTIYYIRVSNDQQDPITYNLESLAGGCPKAHFGPNCTNSTTDLTGNTNATEYTGTGDYQYFFLQGSTLVVGVGTKKLAQPAPTLLASIWNYPSNETALLVSYNQTVNFISAHNPNDVAASEPTWFISVWAYEGQDYYIWANIPCPNNCSGSSGGNTTHGTCNVGTGMCDCDKGYSGLFCDKSGLALVWIIIIVIVCAIILAIAIGVPVACFLRNRRRARYERV